ncbi:DUF4158 domain-containing protein [Streptomyces olivaceoviridis]
MRRLGSRASSGVGMTSIERTAYPRFKRLITARELHVFFPPGEEERVWAEEVTDSDEHQLALLVALKSYQRMGCFPKVYDVPAQVVEFVRRAVELPESTLPVYASGRTAERYRSWVHERCQVRYDGPARNRPGSRILRPLGHCHSVLQKPPAGPMRHCQLPAADTPRNPLLHQCTTTTVRNHDSRGFAVRPTAGISRGIAQPWPFLGRRTRTEALDTRVARQPGSCARGSTSTRYSGVVSSRSWSNMRSVPSLPRWGLMPFLSSRTRCVPVARRA